MSLLLENAVAVGAVGAVATTFAGLVFLARRTGKSAAALAVVLALTFVLLAVERFVVTDREQIETSLQQTLDAIEANDLPALLTHIDPKATMIRADAEAALPLIQVKATGGSQVITTVNSDNQPATAETKFRGMINGTSKKGGALVGYFDDVEVTWTKRDDRWLIDGYTIYNKGKPINAVQRLRAGN
ncbi:MAG: hypothetical protein RH917_02585 [Lacipirellulaceae bacterium]